MQEVIVVLKPLRQDMKRDDPPAPLPNLKSKKSIDSRKQRLLLLYDSQTETCKVDTELNIFLNRQLSHISTRQSG